MTTPENARGAAPGDREPRLGEEQSLIEQGARAINNIRELLEQFPNWEVVPCHYIFEGYCSCGDVDCTSPGKHPRTRHGVRDATRDPAQIEAWLRANPDVNWAVATGARSGIWVLDVDADKRGVESLAEWLREKDVTRPPTLVVATGGGGWHLYFQHESGIRNRVGVLPGVDVRSDGGYVILPGSAHISGRRYSVAESSRVADAPPALVDLVKSDKPAATGSWVGAGSMLDPIPEGHRDDTLFRMACALRRKLNDDRAAIEALVLARARASGFPEHEALAKVEQAFAQDHSDEPLPVPFAVGGEDFWVSRPELEAIHRNARAAFLAPWAVLGGAVLRALFTVPYWVSYRSFRGKTSLNIAIINAGASGGGKSLTRRVLDTTLAFEFEAFGAVATQGFPVREAGSGEGIVDSYASVAPARGNTTGLPPGSLVWRDESHAQLFNFDEVGKLTAMSKRDGSTIFEYIKSAVSGEGIGRTLAGGAGVFLPADSYRFGLTINVQPGLAGALLRPDMVEGGFPGRFAWFATQDPTLAKGDIPPSGPPVKIPLPSWEEGATIDALPEMDAAHEADARAYHGDQRDAIAGHELLTRAKVAVGLMVLAGRTSLVSEDWNLAGTVMEHSRATRAAVMREVREAEAAESERKGRARGRQDSFAAQTRAEATLQRAVAALRRFQADGVPQGQWKSRLKYDDTRNYYDEALAIINEHDPTE